MSGGSGNIIQGNYVGLASDGVTALGNANLGVQVDAGSNNTIGGTASNAGNVISANANIGVEINAASTGTTVQGNLIGTNKTGTLDRGNTLGGVQIANADNNTIGGTAAGAGNVISGNGDPVPFNNASGVEVSVGTGNLIRGNYIGVAADGATALGNTGAGTRVVGGSGNTIGGTAAGAGNVISSNGTFGVDLNGSTSGNVVQGNLIGTDKTGTLNRGNAETSLLINGSSNNTIGGTAPNAGNTIAFGGIDGIEIDSGTGNSIRANSIFSNNGFPADGLGIDLDGDYVTANDTGDGDTGANGAQNYPVISQATSAGVLGTTINGTLNSAAGTDFHLDFYSSPSCDPSGFGEGQVYVGAQDVTTDGSGNAPFSAAFPSVTVAPGDVVSATATDPAGNTSEFAQCATVNVGGSGGSLTGSLIQDPPPPEVNLTAYGTQDWAIWGYAAGGTSTSLAPDDRKAGASARCRDLTNIDPAPSIVLRALGQFFPPVAIPPYHFDWSNGTSPAADTNAQGGLQHDGQQQALSTLNHGFAFDVPAGTLPEPSGSSSRPIALRAS